VQGLVTHYSTIGQDTPQRRPLSSVIDQVLFGPGKQSLRQPRPVFDERRGGDAIHVELRTDFRAAPMLFIYSRALLSQAQ
jgi:hypothetical protein